MISHASRKKKGFTLIEVTLAIVIGIVMIAGATLIYNQAKNSAGNSRASSKVVALQQVIEEFAAQNQGVYPTVMRDINDLWVRKRPDDWNKSPWGGVIGTSYSPNSAHINYAAGSVYTPAAAGGVGVIAMANIQTLGTQAAPAGALDGARALTLSSGYAGSGTVPAGAPYTGYQANVHDGAIDVQAFNTFQGDTVLGGLVYMSTPNNERIVVRNDQVTNASVYAKGYVCFIVDAVGRFPNFTVGPKPNN